MTRRDPLLIVGLLAVFAAAVVASFSTLASLATAAGWHGRSAWLLPVCIDALGMFAGRVWMSPKARDAARVYGRRVTLAAVVLSVLGNAAGHLVSTDHIRPDGLVLVVLVGAVPAASLAAVVHLAVLVWSPVPGRRARSRPVPEAAPLTEPTPVAPSPKAARTPRPSRHREPVTDEVLLQRARHADEQYRAKHGRPINRDDLKKALRVSSGRASEILALLKAEAEVA